MTAATPQPTQDPQTLATPLEAPSAFRPWRWALISPVVFVPVIVALAISFQVELLYQSAAGAVFLVTLLCCTITDLRNRRIYNWVTYTAAFWALLLGVAAYLLPVDQQLELLNKSDTVRHWVSRIDIGSALLGFALGFGIMFFLFTTFGCGGGDLKMIAAAGLFVGHERLLEGLIYSYIVAGVGALCYVVWVVGPWVTFTAMLRSVTKRFGMPLAFLGPQTDMSAYLKLGMPMAPFYSAGLLLAVYFQPF